MTSKDRAVAAIDAASTELFEISHWMYEHPETAYEEYKSSARLAEYLRGKGFDVEYPAYGLETAFAARVGDDGPHVVICAEYDALPGVGHACGHNIIAAAALGAGTALAALVGELGIRLTVLGTPAEEHYGGKVDMIVAGAFEGVAAAMMVHPSTEDVVDPNVIAVAHIDVHYHGKAAHASAHPQLGVNALDAFVQAYVNVSTLRQAIYPTDKIHGVIREGGDAPNIVPAYTRSSWYVRAATKERLDILFPQVAACFEAAAIATGCRVELEHVGHTYTEMISDQTLVEYYAANTAELGRPMARGRDLPADQTGSTDMGNVSLLVPTIHPMLDISASPHVNHQPEFAAHTITPDGDRAIVDGATAMAWTVIDLAEHDAWTRLGSPVA
ncbi:MAG TPA: M20 family metallopeptidase [Acidimicrobiia bacterium]|nr:M20 family metallopeptidase [Acidimicrobiia bacterium]